MPGIDVKMAAYGDRAPGHERYNSEDSLEDNQSTTSSTESRQSDFHKKDHEFIPTRTSGILANKPANNPGQFTRVNSNPLLISAQKQMLLVEEVRKKKQEIQVGEEVPEWQSNLDVWKSRRRKQSEEALSRLSEVRMIDLNHSDNGSGGKKLSIGRKISLQVENDDEIDLDDLPGADEPSYSERKPSNSQVSKIVEESDEEYAERPPSQAQAEKKQESFGHLEKVSGQNGGIIGSKFTSDGGKSASADSEHAEDFSLANNSRIITDKKSQDTYNPYQNAIDSYKTFASSHLSSESKPAPEAAAPQSQSNAEAALASEERRATSTEPLHDDSLSASKEEEKWEEKIESFIQPSRKMSSELSEKMRLKLASFEEAAVAAAASNASTRDIQPDNTFREKLKVFKTFETTTVSYQSTSTNSAANDSAVKRFGAAPSVVSSASSRSTSSLTAAVRRESEPAFSSARNVNSKSISNFAAAGINSNSSGGSAMARLKSTPALFGGKISQPTVTSSSLAGGSTTGVEAKKSARSVSTSALMNTMQNNKFYQKNSLSSGGSSGGSEAGDDPQLLEDALEESFSVLEEKETLSKPIFSADDFLPSTERLAPPSEKPPPLPSVPPPPLDEDKSEDDELAKKEQEILDTLEREEREKFNLNNNSGEEDKTVAFAGNKMDRSGGREYIVAGNVTADRKMEEIQQSTDSVVSHASQQLNSKMTGGPKPYQQQRSQSSSSMMTGHHHQMSSSTTTTTYHNNIGPAGYHQQQMHPPHQGGHGGYPHHEQPPVERSRSTTGLEVLEPSGARGSQPDVRGSQQLYPPNHPMANNNNNPDGGPPGGRRRSDNPSNKDYNKHWLIQEAEQRRIFEAKQRQHQQQQAQQQHQYPQQQPMPTPQQPQHHYQQQFQQDQQVQFDNMEAGHVNNNNNSSSNMNGAVMKPRPPQPMVTDNIYANVDPAMAANYNRNNSHMYGGGQPAHNLHQVPQVPPRMDQQVPPRQDQQQQQDRVLSVSGKKKCSHCREELGRGAAMIIESLRLFYHIRCFKCCVCSVQLGNGEHGTDVRVRNNRLHCQNCYSNDEGLKFSKV